MQQSIMFHAYVNAIENSLDQAIPELRKTFGKSLTIDEVVKTIGTDELMRTAINGKLFHRETFDGKVILRSDIPGIYRKALDEEIIKSIWGQRYIAGGR